MVAINNVLVFFFALLLLSVLFKYSWAYLVVRLFPEAVEKNLIAREISWKIAILFAIIFMVLK
ncbi:MAG: hypothetical protein GXZ06_05990 [Tissierellia bacterium]|nr:hypothetical protein [Tissierellia bacterium]